MERSAIPVVPQLIGDLTGWARGWLRVPFARMAMEELYDFKRQTRLAMMTPGKDHEPGWTLGLRQLYGAVAEQPMPADFDDLLDRLGARPKRDRRI